MKLWAGRFQKEADQATDDFNSSISFDSRMYKQDIEGSLAHVAMLGATGILSKEDAQALTESLADIRAQLEAGKLKIDPALEDIHTFVEAELTRRVGDAGKRLHTGRSRNDQVALDLRLYLREQLDGISEQLMALVGVCVEQAALYKTTVMPGYTHLQRAQPVTFGHHLLAYCEMFLRDADRLADCRKRMNVSPLGSGALAGTTYMLDRRMVAAQLQMEGVTANSIDGVSDRDFVIEFLAALSLIMVHLSRFCEEIILWCSSEFRFLELDDAFSTGSSIMPQKKNPDIAELCRGKSGRVFGSLMAMLTVMKGLPLAYNKDMQEDKQAVFDASDTVIQCLKAFTPMLQTARVNADAMRAAAARGFINATDCADYLVGKGLPFRDAYHAVGVLVAECIAQNTTLEALPLAVYQSVCPLFCEDVYDAIRLETCVQGRMVYGGPSAACIDEQIGRIRFLLGGVKP